MSLKRNTPDSAGKMSQLEAMPKKADAKKKIPVHEVEDDSQDATKSQAW